MTQKQRPAVDEKSYDLAEHFLSEVPGATEDNIWELAAILQTACEDACREVEERQAGDEVTIDRLIISVRAVHGLQRAGAKTVSDVRAMTDGELLRTDNFGRKSLAEVREAVRLHQWCEP